MGRKRKEPLTPEEMLFEERVERIKKVFGVKTDADLAKNLGNISQQAISYARRKKSIPRNWIEHLDEIGVPVMPIFENSKVPNVNRPLKIYREGATRDRDYEAVISYYTGKKLKRSVKRSVSETPPVRIANSLIDLVADKIGVEFSEYKENIFKETIIKTILPDLEKKIIELNKKIDLFIEENAPSSKEG